MRVKIAEFPLPLYFLSLPLDRFQGIRLLQKGRMTLKVILPA
jgi:hypothetical protein